MASVKNSVLPGLAALLLPLLANCGGSAGDEGEAKVKVHPTYPSIASKEERKAMDQLASEIEGAVIYTRKGRVKKVVIGDWRVIDLGEGDYVRWGPLGRRIAVLHHGAIDVMSADGSNRKRLVDGGVKGSDGCQIEFHTNGREILYGMAKGSVWSVDIASGKNRDLRIPFETEMSISADGRHLVGRQNGCFLVELPGTKTRKYAGGCSPCISPDGKRVANNIGSHKKMELRTWNGDRLSDIESRRMKPDTKWDNMHWSNHDDLIAMQGDRHNEEAYAFRVSRNEGTRLTWEGRTRYPDLFVSRDLKTGRSPMQRTLAWTDQKGGEGNLVETSPAKSEKKSGRAAEVLALTGSPTRIVWCQSVKGRDDYCALEANTRLMGFCTEDGKGERVIASKVTSYAKPIFTPDGRRVVYSDRTKNAIHIVDWDGSNRQNLGFGYASDLWRDPHDGVVWLYYRAGDGRTKGGVMRQQLDNPRVREKVWDQTPTGHDKVPWFRLSADGTRAASAFPFSSCGVADLVAGRWDKYGSGCWASLAPDNSYRFFNFLGSHREIVLFEAGKKNGRNIKLNGAPSVGGGKKKVYHPRWSNDVRYLTVTGPKESNGQEVLLGRFDSRFTKVEKWVQISSNDKPDFYGDAWMQSGWTMKSGQTAVPEAVQTLGETQDPSPFGKWPGDQRDLVFLWESNKATNQIVKTHGEAGRLCRVAARDRALIGRNFEMDLAGGAFVAIDSDAALLDACKRSNALAVEAAITPGIGTQDGRIVSFAGNFTLDQLRNVLVMKLRTDSGEQQIEIGTLEAGKTTHLVVSYQPGRLLCFIDGVKMKETDHLAGRFGNWEPSHLLFGDARDGGHDWNGTLEGVAIYARAIAAQEARHKYDLSSPRYRDRKPLDRLVVEGKLLEITPTPTVAALKEYPRGLVVYLYEVAKVVSGVIEEEKLRVAHWAILDRQILPELGGRKLGETYRLQLESFDAHPQLQSERSFEDSDPLDALFPMYYDIGGRGLTPQQQPQVAHASMPKEPIHLKVNCAGPSLGDWESDAKFVSRSKAGSKYTFRRKADTSKVSGPAPVEVYRTVRHRPHAYHFDVPNGDYLVRLHFTDDHDPKGKQRKMDFVIEEQRALRGFNVVAAAGGVGKAVVKEIPVRVSDGNGLQIRGEDPKGGDVFAAGIEVMSR